MGAQTQTLALPELNDNYSLYASIFNFHSNDLNFLWYNTLINPQFKSSLLQKRHRECKRMIQKFMVFLSARTSMLEIWDQWELSECFLAINFITVRKLGDIEVLLPIWICCWGHRVLSACFRWPPQQASPFQLWPFGNFYRRSTSRIAVNLVGGASDKLSTVQTCLEIRFEIS